MKFIVILICFSLCGCAPWQVDKPQKVTESRVAVCKKTGSRITRPCDSRGSITQDQWDDVKASVAKPPPTAIAERRTRKR